MASIRDVAKEAGVSPATVSRTFTTPSLINQKTHQRVLDAATLLGYAPPRLRPRRNAGSNPGSRRVPGVTDALGFQFFAATSSPGDTLFANPFYAHVLAGAQAEAAALGLHLLVHTTDRHALSLELPRMIQEQAIGGLLLVGTAEPAILRAFAERVPNIVLVDNDDETETHECVISDGFRGALTATKYLLDLGHRRIGFFLTERVVMSFRDRVRGYQCSLLEHDVVPEPTLTFGVGAMRDDNARADLVALLRSPERPTAVVTANDEAAVFLLRVCREIGLSVPEDLSVVGFDDISTVITTDPPLTTIRVDTGFLGRLAVRRLRDRLIEETESGRAQPPVRHVIPVSLVIRGSCRPIRQ